MTGDDDGNPTCEEVRRHAAARDQLRRMFNPGSTVGIKDVWPDDDPSERVRLTVESVRSPFDTRYVADRAEVTKNVARRELSSMADRGWVKQTEPGEWRVVEDVLDDNGLFPDE